MWLDELLRVTKETQKEVNELAKKIEAIERGELPRVLFSMKGGIIKIKVTAST